MVMNVSRFCIKIIYGLFANIALWFIHLSSVIWVFCYQTKVQSTNVSKVNAGLPLSAADAHYTHHGERVGLTVDFYTVLGKEQVELSYWGRSVTRASNCAKVPMLAGLILPNLLWSATSILYCDLAIARCFSKISSKLKQVAPYSMETPAAEIKALFGQILSSSLCWLRGWKCSYWVWTPHRTGSLCS